LQLPEAEGPAGFVSARHLHYLIAGVCACPGWAVLEEMATNKWHSICFQMVSKPQTPITKLDKQGLNGELRLAAGEAADDGGRHGESD
jgi:hypothetical protein